MVHAEVVRNEDIGRSDGTPGPAVPAAAAPGACRRRSPACCTSIDGDRSHRLDRRCAHFAESGPDDRHFRIDAFAGEVQFGPAVRQADGDAASATARCRRAGARLRLAVVPHRRRACAATWPPARSGCSRPASRTSRGWRTATPAVGGAERRDPRRTRRLRGPLLLRSRGRAVTAEDFDRAGPRGRAGGGPGALRRRRRRRRRGRAGAGGAARGQRRRRPDPPGRPGPAGRVDSGADQPTAWTSAGWSAPGCWSQPPDYAVAHRGGQRRARGRGTTRARCATRCSAALYRLFHPLVGGPDGHRLAVRPLGAGARGARGAGPDPGRGHGPRRCSVQLFPADAGHRPARRRRRSGSTCRRPRWCSPTSTRSGSQVSG